MKRYLLLILATASCMAPDRTRATLRKAGFEDVRVTGYEPLACGKDDWYSTGFSGKNSKGQHVSGVVCCGLLTKQCTIRF